MDSLNGFLAIRELDAADAARWDAFVDRCPDATFFHRAGWKRAIEAGLQHPCPYLYAERDGEIVGVLPLVHIRSRLFGHALIATGFTVGGGPLAEDATAWFALDTAAMARAEALGVDYLEYRSSHRCGVGWHSRGDLYVTFARPLDPDPERNLLAIPRKQRAMIRKGIAAGLASETDPDIDRLHHIYAVSTRNLGTPVYPRRFFRALREAFPDETEVLTVLHGRTPVASVLSFRFRGTIMPYFGGGTEQARSLAGNDFMYWEVMRRACLSGLDRFDFGRSKAGTGSFSFKKNWGFTPTPLTYSYHLRNLDRLPEVNPSNPRYRLFIKAWRHLPLPVSKLLGPPIARNLG